MGLRWNEKNENRFNLYNLKRVALIVQERKRKYKENKKPDINKSIWNKKRKKWVGLPLHTKRVYMAN